MSELEELKTVRARQDVHCDTRSLLEHATKEITMFQAESRRDMEDMFTAILA